VNCARTRGKRETERERGNIDCTSSVVSDLHKGRLVESVQIEAKRPKKID
jgi:hypothetical protein